MLSYAIQAGACYFWKQNQSTVASEAGQLNHGPTDWVFLWGWDGKDCKFTPGATYLKQIANS